MKDGETDAVAAPNPPVLVIGYGNELRGDDGVGCVAARRLSRRLPKAMATVLALHQLLPELAETASRARLVIFIDADATLPPGETRCLAVGDVAEGGRSAMAHYQSAAGILKMARDLYGSCPRGLLFSIGAASFEYTRALSPPVRAGLRKLLSQIEDAIRQCEGERAKS